MKVLATLLLCILTSLSLQSQVIFQEDFESPDCAFKNIKRITKNPAQKKTCGLLQPADPKTGRIALASCPKLIPVKPNTWYRFSFQFKNTIGNGEIKYGFNESRSAEKLETDYYCWQWRGLPLNIAEWNRYSGEFLTAKNTQGILLYLRTETISAGDGAAWFDDFKIEEFVPTLPYLEIKPFEAAASYTDITTRQAYTNPKVHDAKTNTMKMELLWRDLDLAQMPVEVTYNKLPKNTLVTAILQRGTNVVFRQNDTLSGSGEIKYNLGLDKLPEGIYVFYVGTTINNKTTLCSKEIWRIKQADIRIPKLEPIQTVSAGPNRYRLVNGKPIRIIHASACPGGGILEHIQKNCKPDLGTYLDYMQEQFGLNYLTIWDWRGNRWDNKLDEYYDMTIKYNTEWMDIYQKHNFYCGVGFDSATERGRELPTKQRIQALTSGLKKHPAFMEWYLDEPEIPKYKPEDMIQLYKWLKEMDPTHTVNVNLCQYSRFKEFAPSTDIGSLDVYPFPGASLKDTDHRMQKLIEAFPTAPIYTYLQYFNFNELPMPNFDQIRGTFVLDRIYGSHDLVFYAWGERRQSILTDMELQAYFRAIYALYMKYEAFAETAREIPFKLEGDTRDVRVKALSNGKETVVLMVNLSKDASANVSFKTDAKVIEDFMDNTWKYPFKNGTYSTQLNPNGTRILRLK